MAIAGPTLTIAELAETRGPETMCVATARGWR
jgi:hypothetical protein